MAGKAAALDLRPDTSPQLKGLAVTPVFRSPPQHKEFVFHPAQDPQRTQPKQGHPATEESGSLAAALCHAAPDRALPQDRPQAAAWLLGDQPQGPGGTYGP